MQAYIQREQLQVAKELATFIEDHALPGSEVSPADFWASFSNILAQLTPVNLSLIHI